jgi:SagB-type dehydrogenase family enzyme
VVRDRGVVKESANKKRAHSMTNMDVQRAWRYHNGTKHPNGYLLDFLHSYNPANRPKLYKDYLDLESIPLPLDLSPIGISALKAIAGVEQHSEGESIPDFGIIARILHLSAGVTKRIQYPPPWGEMAFRAAACTGALYHIELYLVCRDLPDLEAGVYHYAALQSGLKQLRKGDYRDVLIKAGESEDHLALAPASLVFTHVPWRNACKYQARAYRHAFWDSGTILSQTLTMTSAHGVPVKVILGFFDEPVNALLDLDVDRELPLALVAIGFDLKEAPVVQEDLEPLSLNVGPASEDERIFSAIHEMHQASSLSEVGEVEVWRDAPTSEELHLQAEESLELQPMDEGDEPGGEIEHVIKRRGSSRRFRQEPITFQQLSTILEKSTESLPIDYLKTGRDFLNHAYLIVNDVEDLDPGAYLLDQEQGALELLKPGSFRDQAGHLALDQDLGFDASVNLYFLTSLRDVFRRFGNRGYRAAQLEAAVRAGRIYLASYALGLGATGLTFFDDEVTEFFSPHALDKSVMFLIAIGIPGKRR